MSIGFAESPQSGLIALDRLASEPQLSSYSYLEAARADFLMRLGRIEEARVAFDAARSLTTNDVELEFLAQRLVQLDLESG